MIGILFMILLLISLFRSEPYHYHYCSRQRLIEKYKEDQMWKKIGFSRTDNFKLTVGKRGGICMSGSGRLQSKFKLKNWLKRKFKDKNSKLMGRIAFSLIIIASIYYLTGFFLPIPYGVMNTWTNGNANGNWSDGGNWDQGHKPAATEDVTIPDTSVIGKCTMDENSNAQNSLTINASGELELATFTLSLTSFFTNAGTFTCNTGTVSFDGNIQQDVTSGGDAFYNIVLSNTTTVYLKDNMEAFDILIPANTTFEIDAISEGAALTLSFTDIENCGFSLADAGTFLCQGNGTFGITITSAAGAGLTNYYKMNTSDAVTMDYTTIEYFATYASDVSHDIDYCTFQNSDGTNMVTLNGAVTSFTNNTITGGAANTACVLGLYGAATFTNLTITSTTSTEVKFNNATSFEFTNSSFDFTKLSFANTAATVISDGHNTVATDYYIATGSTGTLSKSAVTNDFGTGYSVLLTEGTFKADEASACLSFDIQSGTTLQIDAVTYGGALTWAFDDVAGAGFLASAGTLECIGSGANGVTITSAGAPAPGVYWNAGFAEGISLIMDYTTLSYYVSCGTNTTMTVDIDNCIFDNWTGRGFQIWAGTITSFTNNTFQNSTASESLRCYVAHTGFDNITFNANTTNHITQSGKLEFTDSSFSTAKLALGNNGFIISKNHNDVANDYYIMGRGATGRLSKSTIVNDMVSTDNVIIMNLTTAPCVLVADEAIAHNNLTIKNNAELEIDANITWTITQGATVTVESGGTLDITGSAGNLITIVSSTPTMEWILTAETGSIVSVSYCDVQDSNATTSDYEIDASDGTNVDSGRNVNWDFGNSGGGTGAASSMVLGVPFWAG